MELKQSQYWRNQISFAFARRHTSSIAKASLKNKIEQARISDAMEEKMNDKAKELLDMFENDPDKNELSFMVWIKFNCEYLFEKSLYLDNELKKELELIYDTINKNIHNFLGELCLDIFSLTNNKLNTDVANDTVESLTHLFKNHKERDTFTFLLYLNRKIDKLLKQNHSKQDKQKLKALQEAVLSKKEDRRKILFNN